MALADKIFNSLFDGLTPRQKEVLVGRFGVEGDKPQTLAALGKRYGVTRERIRQIEAGALNMLSKRAAVNSASVDLLNRSQKYLKNIGGVGKEDSLVNYHLASFDGLNKNHLNLLAEATGNFEVYPEDGSFHNFYYLDKKSLDKAGSFISQFAKYLKSNKDEVLGGGYATHLARFIKQQKIDAKIAENYLAISKKIHTNPYGDTGLADWPEIKPKTIRDRIYLVLKKREEPVHFEAIAKFINEVAFSGRKALAPTVHNELIKDNRFVLVGRGIYGLAERGYQVGTAKEVIHKILKKNGPLNFQQIVSSVQKDRFFKTNTILANLQNKDLFERLNTGTYRIRES